MIEFRGTYCDRSNSKSLVVLVQFDGVLLHVWHQSDPFYRILSCDAFQIATSLVKGQRCIKLSNGDRILTDDITAADTLSQVDLAAGNGAICPCLSGYAWLVATLSTVSALIAIWWFAKNGFPF